ncbi:MAG: ferrochelatase, partial [Deltaproteobacteria bacterium]|nr:ferrochelatase [Deltaproteobacteria bacterium]
MTDYDAFLLLSFGGPEGPDDVMPFLENVTRGRSIPRERLLTVAGHYQQFGGKSPINDQCRELLAAVGAELQEHQEHGADGPPLPLYWGNRNWGPFLVDTLREMKAAGVKKALGFVTSAYGSYSGCRQYQEDVKKARAEVGEGAPEVHLLRKFYDHPGFIEANAARVMAAYGELPEGLRDHARLVFTAHSVPMSM